MIDFEFNFKYDSETIPALKGVSGQIESGTCIVLCGGSGCGKSTLLRCLNKLVPQFYEGELNGFYRINGKDIDELSIGEVGELAASVFQDPRSQFFTVNSSTEVAFGLENHGVLKEKISARVDKAFEFFRLDKLKNRNVYELSCGERQLVSILSAWAMDTEIILLDEPTANLDIAAIAKLRGLLLRMKEQGKTLILSEHRLYYLADIADEFWLVENGKLQARYSPKELKKLITENPNLLLRTLDLNNVSIAARSFEHSETKLFSFEVSNLCFGYNRKNSELLHNVTFSSECGEVVGLIGANGCGKTTLGKLICGLLRQSSGKITFEDKALKTSELRCRSMFVMQEAEFQFFTNSVINELKYGHNDDPEFLEKSERLLKKFGMWELRDRHPFSLSGGQMQKLSLMIAYFSEKTIIVLDEPTAGLDKKSMQSCAELIGEMRCEKLVFIITHDVEFIAQVCTKCVCISDNTAVREIELSDNENIKNLINFMRGFHSETSSLQKTKAKKLFLNPIVKLLYLLAVMIAVSLSDNLLISTTYAALVILLFADGRRWAALASGGIFALLLGLNALFPNTMASFALVFFPRVLAVGLSMYTLIGADEASRTLAALRKIHTPEKLIMICAVIFRFFPVLSEDMKLMKQSIRTRGAFQTFFDKLKSLPEYVEILTVPIALRVIRIAETLSASAETRGIDLKRKKTSYITLDFGIADIILLILLTAAIAVGIIC